MTRGQKLPKTNVVIPTGVTTRYYSVQFSLVESLIMETNTVKGTIKQPSKKTSIDFLSLDDVVTTIQPKAAYSGGLTMIY